MKRAIVLIFTVVFIVGGTISQAAENDIVDVASNDPTFSILVSALQEADLVSALQAEGPFTVFAPTDDAFKELLNELDINIEVLLFHPELSKVLLNHVVSGKVMSSDLSDGMTANSLHGEVLNIGVGSSVTVNSSTVTTADIEATNGVIHVIDKVLVPSDFKLEVEMMMEEKPDIVGVALGDPQFSMLVSLLQKADLVSALQSEGPFTVFAPTNDAFNALTSSLGITSEELMAQPDLASVLLYHVVSGKVMSTDLTNGLQAETLNGESVSFDLGSGVMVNTSNVIVADVEASNGVVHVIDAVLIPEGFVLESVSMDATGVPRTGDSYTIPFIVICGISLAGLIYGKRKING